MSIVLGCVKCDAKMQVSPEQSGKTVKCGKCGQMMRVPQVAPPPLPPPRQREEPHQGKERKQREDRPRQRRRDDHYERGPDSDCRPLPKWAPAEAHELGAPLEFLNDTNVGKVFGFVLLFVGVALAVAGGAYLFVTGESIAAGGLALGVGVVVTGISTIYQSKRPDKTWICQDGFVWQRGRRITCAPWHEVRLFKPKKTTYVNDQLAVVVLNGGALTWDLMDCQIGFANGKQTDLEGKDMIEFLTRRILRSVYPMYLERIENGKTVKIAPFSLTTDGLRKGKETVAWPDVEGVDVWENEILIRVRGRNKDIRVPLSECALTSVFVPLALTLMQKYGRGEEPDRDPLDFD